MSARVPSPYQPKAAPDASGHERPASPLIPKEGSQMPKPKHQPDHIIAKNEGGGSFTPHPEGQFAARCVDVIDMGEKVEQYGDNPAKLSHKVNLVFRTGEKNEKGEYIDLAKEFTLSMFDLANLRKFLEAWRGKTFTDAEVEEGAPLHKLCGVTALLSVEQKQSKGGRTYANISSAVKLPKMMEPGAPIGDDYERPAYLIDRKAEYATAALGYRQSIGATIGKAKAALGDDMEGFPPEPMDDDDLPF